MIWAEFLKRRNFASGSTATRTSQNVMKDAIRSTGIEASTRRRKYLSTQPTRSGQASSSCRAACHAAGNLLVDSPLIDVPEHAGDRVVHDRSDHLLVPDQNVGKRVEREGDRV